MNGRAEASTVNVNEGNTYMSGSGRFPRYSKIQGPQDRIIRWPQRHNLKKLSKGPLGGAAYKISRLWN